jgi:methionine synthase II (cobalamin-independent)
MAPPFRMDQVGSLLRPKALIEARKNTEFVTELHRLGPQDSSDNAAPAKGLSDKQSTLPSSNSSEDALANLKKEQDAAIRDVVAEQLQRHILPITTGEYERAIFFGNFFESLSGFELRYTPLEAFKKGFPTNRPLIEWGVPGRAAGFPTASKVSPGPKSAYLDDWLFLRSLLPKEKWSDAKITLPPPGWWHIQLREPFDRKLYSTDEALLADLAAALRHEIMTLYDAGLRHVQIDDPNLSFFCDEVWIATCKEEGVDLDRLLQLYIDSHTAAVADLPAELRIGVHICRGNFPNGVGLASGSYARIARRLFTETPYQTFYLEFDSPRAGDFSPLAHLPQDKAVVLGVVTTKSAEMEDLNALKERVYQAADIVAKGQGGGRTREDALRDNLAVSPQCGFASDHSEGGTGMDRQRMFDKLDLVRRLALEIWPGWEEKR